MPELKLVPPFFSDWVGGDPAHAGSLFFVACIRSCLPGKTKRSKTSVRPEKLCYKSYELLFEEQKCCDYDGGRNERPQEQTQRRDPFGEEPGENGLAGRVWGIGNHS